MQRRKIFVTALTLAVLVACSSELANAWQPGKAGTQKAVSKIPRGSGKFDGPPVKPVDPGSRAEVQKSAARID